MKALLAVATVLVVTATVGAAPRSHTPRVDLDARRAAIIPQLARQPESRVIAVKTQAALTVHTSAGPVLVWVAPTRDGGRCSAVDIVALPVESAGPVCTRDRTLRPWESETVVGDGTLRLFGARVPRATESLELRFANGKREQLRTSSGFVLRELSAGERPLVVVLRDERGREIRRPMPGPRSFRRDLPFPTGDYRTVIRLAGSALAVAPGTNGTVCARIEHRRERTWSCGPGAGRLEPRAVAVREEGQLLVGEVGGAISRLEVWFDDGSAVRLPVAEQYVLFEVPKGRTPKLLVGLDDNGAIVARQRL